MKSLKYKKIRLLNYASKYNTSHKENIKQPKQIQLVELDCAYKSIVNFEKVIRCIQDNLLAFLQNIVSMIFCGICLGFHQIVKTQPHCYCAVFPIEKQVKFSVFSPKRG